MYRYFFGSIRGCEACRKSGKVKELCRKIRLFVRSEPGYNFLHSHCTAIRRVQKPDVYLPWNALLTVGPPGLKKESDYACGGGDIAAYGCSGLHAVPISGRPGEQNQNCY